MTKEGLSKGAPGGAMDDRGSEGVAGDARAADGGVGPTRQAFNNACARWLSHKPDCGFHLDQYPWECTCRK